MILSPDFQDSLLHIALWQARKNVAMVENYAQILTVLVNEFQIPIDIKNGGGNTVADLCVSLVTDPYVMQVLLSTIRDLKMPLNAVKHTDFSLLDQALRNDSKETQAVGVSIICKAGYKKGNMVNVQAYHDQLVKIEEKFQGGHYTKVINVLENYCGSYSKSTKSWWKW